MNNKYGLFICSLMSMAILVACDSAKQDSSSTGFTDVVVQGSKTEEENAFCKNFSLNAKQAKAFFDKSKFIDAKTMHDKYDYLPCYVYGTIQYKNDNCSWEVRAGGTGIVNCPKQEYIIACDSCNDLLKD